MQKEVKGFAAKLVRPAGIELDLAAAPEAIFAKNSPLWGVFAAYRKLDLHLPGIDEKLGGMGQIDPHARVLMAQSLGHADMGLAISLMVSDNAFGHIALLGDKALLKAVGDYCADSTSCSLIGSLPASFGVLPLTYEATKGPAPALTARPKGKQLEISGQLPRVFNANIASHLITDILVEPPDLPPWHGLAAIPLEIKGVTRGNPQAKTGQRSLNQASLSFENARIPAAFVQNLANPGFYESVERLTAERAQFIVSAYNGAALCAWEEALAYSKKRVQGGTPIFNHKNIRFQLFDMFKKIEASRSFAQRIASYNAVNPKSPSYPHAAGAKCLATETAVDVASQAIQIFGGYGLTKEFPLEKIFRDARVGMIEHGINEELALKAMEGA
jgi:alkylation response protein AidB-like acyl-CoA dehydrogenase